SCSRYDTLDRVPRPGTAHLRPALVLGDDPALATSSRPPAGAGPPAGLESGAIPGRRAAALPDRFVRGGGAPALRAARPHAQYAPDRPDGPRPLCRRRLLEVGLPDGGRRDGRRLVYGRAARHTPPDRRLFAPLPPRRAAGGRRRRRGHHRVTGTLRSG